MPHDCNRCWMEVGFDRVKVSAQGSPSLEYEILYCLTHDWSVIVETLLSVLCVWTATNAQEGVRDRVLLKSERAS